MQKGELYYQLLKREKNTATASKYTKRKQLQLIETRCLQGILCMFEVIFFFLSPKSNSQVTRIIAQKNCKKKKNKEVWNIKY